VPTFQDNRHMEVARLSALHTGHVYPLRYIPGTHFCYRLSRPQGHSAARRIMSTKNSSANIWNRICDVPTCSAVPYPTAPLSAPPPYRDKSMILKRVLDEPGVGVLTGFDRQREGKLVSSLHHGNRPSGFLLAERLLASEEGDYQIGLENQVVLTIVIIGTINRAIETMNS
jgi:hypothetical protein